MQYSAASLPWESDIVDLHSNGLQARSGHGSLCDSAQFDTPTTFRPSPGIAAHDETPSCQSGDIRSLALPNESRGTLRRCPRRKTRCEGQCLCARRRVAQACDRCRRRKIKCDGSESCKNCESYEPPCNYSSKIDKGGSGFAETLTPVLGMPSVPEPSIRAATGSLSHVSQSRTQDDSRHTILNLAGTFENSASSTYGRQYGPPKGYIHADDPTWPPEIPYNSFSQIHTAYHRVLDLQQAAPLEQTTLRPQMGYSLAHQQNLVEAHPDWLPYRQPETEIAAPTDTHGGQVPEYYVHYHP